jgi:glucans biosynthesis protein
VSIIPAATLGLDKALSQAAGARPELGPRVQFTFEKLKSWARMIAAAPYRAPEVTRPDILDKLVFDLHQQIKYRPEMSLPLDREGHYPLQLFHLGHYFKEPVRIFIVEGGEAREVRYSQALFESPADNPARALPENIGFAGFRIMTPDLKTDWLAALGASYFRTSGPFNQYGLSARGLAIDTGLPTPEEFPRFSNYWLEAGERLAVYALLESPSVTGAYRMHIERNKDQRNNVRIDMEIEAELYARKDIARLGVAPFSSMFWYGENTPNRGADWRPEIHDTDGLAVWTGAGERFWRPFNNPPKIMTNTFLDRDIKGFGLLQRDRDFVHYLDDGVFYERRPSVWVEPLDPWGEGALHLLEIPTDDEIHDNIAVYWVPAESFRAGAARRYRYRLSWLDDVSFPGGLARAIGTWTGKGGRPGIKRPEGVRKFVIDFQGPTLAGVGRNDGVELVATLSRGTISNRYSHPVVDQRERWRALFDVTVTGNEPVDLRAYLRQGGRALTETWVYQHFPDI